MDLSIVIVNYNSANDLGKCLGTIYQFTKGINFEIIVIDNNSTEREIEKLPDLFKEVKFIFLEHNYGFSYGCNYGAKLASGNFLAFLNPDIKLVNNIFPELLRFSKLTRETGVCAPQLYSNNNVYQSSTGFKMGFLYEFLEAFMLIKIYRRLYYLFRIKYSNTEAIPVKWVSGAFMVINKEVFESVNGFDTRFFLNYEDIDLCLRIYQMGFSNYCFPFLKSIHAGLSSQGRNYDKLVLNRYESRLIYAEKHYNVLLRNLVRILHILGLIIRILTMFFKKRTVENIQRNIGYRKSFSLYIKKIS